MAVQAERLGGEAAERYWRHTLHAVFALTAARLVWLALGKADLYPDEAQYWWWSQHLSFGYYSKPPVVAWLIAVTTAIFGDDELAVRLAAPLLHFCTALTLFAVVRRLYDARVAAWSAVAYATLPGVSASALIISTDAPLLLCWTVALYAFIRAREEAGPTAAAARQGLASRLGARGNAWWLALGVAAGLGLLSKYAMAYWLVSALLFLLAVKDERRHVKPFLGASLLALLIYSPNFVWNAFHGFVSYHHTEDNAAFHGLAFHTGHLLNFVASQFGVFGPLLFAALILVAARPDRIAKDRRALFLAMFALPTLAMMLVVSVLSRAEPNWAAPTYVSATVLVVAWLLERQWRSVVIASIALHVTAAVAILEAPDVAHAMGRQLPARYNLLHRLHGYRQLGVAVSNMMAAAPDLVLCGSDRETMAELLYYVRPHPASFLKWNGGDNLVHDQFDLDAKPQSLIGRNFLLVSDKTDIGSILARFTQVEEPVEHIVIPLGSGEERSYIVRLLGGFKGY